MGTRAGWPRHPRRIQSRHIWMAINFRSEQSTRIGMSLWEAPLLRSKSSVKRAGKIAEPRRQTFASAELGNPTAELRKTGIPGMGDIPWGAHVCVFYENRDDLLDLVASYFELGLRSNEFCMWAISDPITEADAMEALCVRVPDLDQHLAAGQIEILQGSDWYLKEGRADPKAITYGWRKKQESAVAKGYDGIRVSGNAFWIATDHWKEFSDYERELDQSLGGQKMVVLCTYWLQVSRAVDVLDVARAHQCSIAIRNGDWEFLETPEFKQAKQEIKNLRGALDILLKPFPGHKSLTPRERATLAQIARGASSKESARALGVSPRTIEYHRANIMRKLGAKNTADLIRRVLAE